MSFGFPEQVFPVHHATLFLLVVWSMVADSLVWASSDRIKYKQTRARFSLNSKEVDFALY